MKDLTQKITLNVDILATELQ